MNYWGPRRRTFWRNASHGVAAAALVLLFFGFAKSDGTLIALGVCCVVLTLTFGRRASA